MSEEPQPARTLHDRLFKEFLWIFFPTEAERLDFVTLQFLDKELIINFAGQELRITDLVAEVATWDGVPETIIVHLEVEGRDKVTLPQRMSEYYALLRIFRRKPVLPLALVLLPNAGGLDWQSYQENIFGHTVLHFRYGQVGIRDHWVIALPTSVVGLSLVSGVVGCTALKFAESAQLLYALVHPFFQKSPMV